MTAAATRVEEALRDVLDPEYPISIVDLGLVRGVAVEGGTAHVRITYTSLGCPCTELIQDDIRERLLGIIEGRCASGRNGAQWQVDAVRAFEAHGLDRWEALRRMTQEYVVRMHANTPVHTWDPV